MPSGFFATEKLATDPSGDCFLKTSFLSVFFWVLLFVFDVLYFQYDIYRYEFLFIYIAWNFGPFSNLRVHAFYQFWIKFSQFSFQISFFLISFICFLCSYQSFLHVDKSFSYFPYFISLCCILSNLWLWYS